jgi:hypothetical protein
MNIIKKIQTLPSRIQQKRREKAKIQEIALLVCQEKEYYDPVAQNRLLMDLDDMGIGFPGGK